MRFGFVFPAYPVIIRVNDFSFVLECGKTFQENSASFTSPSYHLSAPSQEPEACEWRITATHGEKIILNITDLVILLILHGSYSSIFFLIFLNLLFVQRTFLNQTIAELIIWKYETVTGTNHQFWVAIVALEKSPS